ncbi:type VI secretion system baseplate subunit TssG [Corallococcus sp. H22C18031201]|uniref:type VI secretion system baseplate subunit TssG n=1 Tax=Citreicoccus inhibens TaxID=2849499 RepID=UPI000E748E2B|nr:type VI secretion system baseplate subunit TssG [Citreicoccus inhibens]MBU8900873.1 type VI secretion system baseplate subunit TssG [Citreicoccus inhibens]RJS14495.1 type VI secretion system baseplate subunit TssG [Corallococcus sp. H22C18031201]
MASEERLPASLVDSAKTLQEAAPRLGFFQVVAALERLTAQAARVGGAGPVTEEMIRFRHDPSLAFSSGEVSEVTLREVPVRPEDSFTRRPLFEVVTRFLGLTGSVSPLPHYLAEEVAQEDPDQAVRREFLDLFHHRLLSLLYRIESKYRVSSETNSTFTDQWSRRLLALAGFDTYEKPREGRLPTWRLLRIAPLLGCRARTADQLEVALQDVLGDDLEGARVTVRQFVGRWVDIDARVQLGRANHVLGRNMLLGGKAFDRTGKIQIHISPLPPRAYRRLMQEGDLQPLVREVVSIFVRDPLEYDLELGLTEGVQQQFRLSRQEPSQLGRDTWLGTSRRTRLNVPVL